MAKKCSVAKQKKKEVLVNRHWAKRQQLKKVIFDLTKGDDEKLSAQIALNKLPKNSSPTRLRNRCQFTGRARGYLRKFRLSRLCFREMASKGLIPGVTKASW